MKKVLFLLCAMLHSQELQITQTPLEIPALPEPTFKPQKNAAIAVSLSIIPGLGHYYLGDNAEGTQLLGGALASCGATIALASTDQWAWIDMAGASASSVWSYGFYAAYRDTKRFNGTAPGFTPQETYLQLTAAPFQWSVLKKPEVWGGYLVALTTAATVSYFAFADAAFYTQPLIAVPVAVGEESFFRGCLQSALLDALPPWAAITTSSLLFGAAHIGNAEFLPEEDRRAYYTHSIPLITALGAYMGCLAYENRSLRECTAFHMWYDFTLFSLALAGGEAMIGDRPMYVEHTFEF
jgi:membrane protease YdiL (CAAX protease family)